MKFLLTQSLFQDAIGKRNYKYLKIVWNKATLSKTDLCFVGTICLLGVIKSSLHLFIALISFMEQKLGTMTKGPKTIKKIKSQRIKT